MFDYTEQGLMARQADIAVAYLDSIDRKLAKMNRRVKVMTFVIIAAVVIKNKEEILRLKNRKGE